MSKQDDCPPCNCGGGSKFCWSDCDVVAWCNEHPGHEVLQMSRLPGDPKYVATSTVRTFETGATRDTDEGKFDYEGFLSWAVLKRYAEYMHENRTLSDGSLRDSDNWQDGIPKDQYMKSMFRHFMEVWEDHRMTKVSPDREENLCALLFNVMGYLFELLDEDDRVY